MSVWTEDRVQALKDGFRAGDSFTQIARKIGGGVSRNAAISKAARLGLGPFPRATASAPGKAKAEKHTVAAASLAPSWPIKGPAQVTDASAAVLALESNHCKWPIGDPHQHGFRFCSDLKDVTDPYCPEHMKAASDAPPERTPAQRAADVKRRQYALNRLAAKKAAAR